MKELSRLEVYDLADLNEQVAKLVSHTKTLIENGFQIVAEVPKKVTWDTEQIEQIIKTIPEDKRKAIVKTTYAIDERKYSQLSYEYQLLFKPARTVTPGKTRFQITLPEDQGDLGYGNF